MGPVHTGPVAVHTGAVAVGSYCASLEAAQCFAAPIVGPVDTGAGVAVGYRALAAHCNVRGHFAGGNVGPVDLSAAAVGSLEAAPCTVQVRGAFAAVLRTVHTAVLSAVHIALSTVHTAVLSSVHTAALARWAQRYDLALEVGQGDYPTLLPAPGVR